MRTPSESNASAKVRCMRPQGSNIATGYGSKTTGDIFRGCAYDRVGRRHAVSVGEMIDSSRPWRNGLTTLYVVDISEGALPFREKVSPNTLFAPLLTLQKALVRCAHRLPCNALGMCVVFDR